MDVERRLIIMRRVMGAVGTVILEILKWILRIILGALKLVLGLARIILLLFAMVARIFLSFVMQILLERYAYSEIGGTFILI